MRITSIYKDETQKLAEEMKKPSVLKNMKLLRKIDNVAWKKSQLFKLRGVNLLTLFC